MAAANAVSKRSHLTLDELEQLRWFLGGLLTLLGVVTVVYIDVGGWTLLVATVAVAIATTLWPRLPARVPRLAHLLAFPFIAAFFAIDLWLHSELLPATVRLDMLLLLYRAMVYRQRRDDLQVIVLGLFLVVVAGVVTVSLAFAAQILVYTACALVFLLVLTLLDAVKAGRAAPIAPSPQKGLAKPLRERAAQPPAWAGRTNWPRLFGRVAEVTDWRVVLLSGALFLGVIVVTGLLFLLIPRFQLDNGMFLDRFITKKSRTGFSETIHFGDVTEIQQDTSVALHIDVADPSQIPLEPYWRMLVLNDYQDGTFRLSPRLRQRFSPPQSGVMLRGRLPARNPIQTWTFYLEPSASRYLPLLGPFRRLRFGEAQNFQHADAVGMVALTKDPATMTAYQVEGFDPASRLKDDPEDFYGGETAGSVRQKTGDDEIVLRRLVAAATGGAKLDATGFSTRICAWLREQHNYSLSPRIPAGAGDPLIRWMDSRAAGHCELFAGSFVLLARTAGFPARVVTGFRGGSWNAYATNSFTVRYSDAHAWAEIFDRASHSWLRADPLEIPNTVEQSGGTANALARLTDRSWSARFDSLRVFWYRRIVSFDQAAQVNTLKAAKTAAQSTLQEVRKRIDRLVATIKGWFQTPWGVGRFTSAFGLLVLAGALTWLWRRLRLWLMQYAPWRRGGRAEDPIRREAGRWLRRIEEQRRSRSAADVVADLQRLRFGARPTWPDPGIVFRRAKKATATRGGEEAVVAGTRDGGA